MVKRTVFAATIALLLASCKNGIKKEQLLGDWKYTKIDKPNGDGLSDTLTTAELAEQAPHITFTNDSLIIFWGGKVLSHGTYDVKGHNINYTEQLPDHKTRTFPFFVSKLNGKQIIFETLDKEGSRVVAEKTL